MSKNNTRDLSHTFISFQNACTLTCITFLICTGYIYRDLHVPFETARDALIAQRVLQPDPILRPEDFQVEYEAKATVLDIHFKAIDDRVLRGSMSIFHLLGTDDSEVVSKLRYIGQGRRGLKSSSYKVYHKMLLCTIRYTDHI
ncbi:EKC/KEOPS complex subunit PCC1 [Nakaseomyces glabratus]|nr:EKC/KEOPS complex subunit PCC1 [Nakaseomyces glabratus]KTB25231.1 EKC/KEOPS complex subunit PCC1 [Nakaseomyces glabratus]